MSRGPTAAARLLLPLLLGPVLVACGEDSSSAPPPAPLTTTATPTPDAPPSTASGDPSPSDVGSSGAIAPDPPADATAADFCGAYAALAGQDTDPTGPAAVSDAKSAVDRLRRVGTPAGIPSDAREGYEVLVALVAAVPDDAEPSRLASVGDDLDQADQQRFVAFADYASTTCTSPD